MCNGNHGLICYATQQYYSILISEKTKNHGQLQTDSSGTIKTSLSKLLILNVNKIVATRTIESVAKKREEILNKQYYLVKKIPDLDLTNVELIKYIPHESNRQLWKQWFGMARRGDVEFKY